MPKNVTVDMNFIRRKLHPSLSHKTMRVVKRLTRLQDDTAKTILLREFVESMKKKLPMQDCSIYGKRDIKSWVDLCYELEYFSDRWCMARLHSLMPFLEQKEREIYERELKQIVKNAGKNMKI